MEKWTPINESWRVERLGNNSNLVDLSILISSIVRTLPIHSKREIPRQTLS